MTPILNQEKYLEGTIQSVLGQGYPNLEYIIIDGGSADNSVNIIKKYEDQLAYWISEQDRGLYDALNKGFWRSTGSIMGWLNGDDTLLPRSLYTIAELFNQHENLDWVQAQPTAIDQSGRLVYNRTHTSSKYAYLLKDHIDSGAHFIAQESTYWRRSLWEKSGGRLESKLKYAGDFELWMRFFNHADLINTHAFIGCFRIREGQLSSENQYMNEVDSVIKDTLSNSDSAVMKNIRRIKIGRKLKHYFGLLFELKVVNLFFRMYLLDKKFIEVEAIDRTA